MLMFLTRNINIASTMFGSDPYSRSKSEREVPAFRTVDNFSSVSFFSFATENVLSTTGTGHLAGYSKTASQFFKSYEGDVSRGRRYK